MATGYKMFEVTATAVFEDRRRDEFGWVDGYGPGNGKLMKPQTFTHRVVCARPDQAVEYVTALYGRGDGTKELKFESIAAFNLDALIVEL